MQATKQIGRTNPKVLTMKDVRPTLRARRDASERLVRQLDLEIGLLRKQRSEELLRQEGLAAFLGMSDDGRLAEILRKSGWVIVD